MTTFSGFDFPSLQFSMKCNAPKIVDDSFKKVLIVNLLHDKREEFGPLVQVCAAEHATLGEVLCQQIHLGATNIMLDVLDWQGLQFTKGVTDVFQNSLGENVDQKFSADITNTQKMFDLAKSIESNPDRSNAFPDGLTWHSVVYLVRRRDLDAVKQGGWVDAIQKEWGSILQKKMKIWMLSLAAESAKAKEKYEASLKWLGPQYEPTSPVYQTPTSPILTCRKLKRTSKVPEDETTTDEEIDESPLKKKGKYDDEEEFGFTREVALDESSAIRYLQIDCGENGQDELQRLREKYSDKGYKHFLVVQWKNPKRYRYALSKRYAKELRSLLELKGEKLKEQHLGKQINNYGPKIASRDLIYDNVLIDDI